MAAADAERLNVVDGQPVRMVSRRGKIDVKASVSNSIAPGTVFAPFHFARAAANRLPHAALDPVSQ